METKIFKSYSDFLNRKDKATNGVSPKFAKEYPNYQLLNQTNKGCWCCVNCDNCTNCISCIYCCNDCNDCVYCDDCKRSKWLQYRTNYNENRLDKDLYENEYNDFCDYINDLYDKVTICDIDFNPSYILEKVEPAMFDMYLLEHIENLQTA